MFLYYISKIRKVFVVLLFVSLILALAAPDLSKALDTAYPIGLPSALGAATTSGEYFVQNLQVQTIYTRNANLCYAWLTWKSPATTPANPNELFYRATAKVGSKTIRSDVLKYGTTTYHSLKELNCGQKYTFSVITYRNPGILAKTRETGKAIVSFTLAKAASENAEEYTISISSIKTTKSGTTCTATINWQQPPKHTNDPRVTYTVVVSPNTDGIKPAPSDQLKNTAKSFTTGKLTCGKPYTAVVSIYSDDNRMYSANQGFNTPAPTAADGTTDATDAPAVLDNVDLPDILPETVSTDASGGSNNELCAKFHQGGIFGWAKNILQTIINPLGFFICALMDSMTGAVEWVMGVDKSGATVNPNGLASDDATLPWGNKSNIPVHSNFPAK